MRAFTVVLSTRGSLAVVKARAFLGTLGAAVLDDELERIRVRLSALPESGNPVATPRGWSRTTRRVVLRDSPYTLFYRVNLHAERVVVYALRHQRSRPPRP